MTCPQCGSTSYSPDHECPECGFTTSSEDFSPVVPPTVVNPKRDLMNGVGFGCSTMCFLWLFAYTFVFAIAAHERLFTRFGPAVANLAPVLIMVILFLLLRRKPSNFSKGVGISLMITLIIAVFFGVVGTKTHETRPPANGIGDGFQ